MKRWINRLVVNLPIIGKWRSVYLKHPNPGHFYSPVPDKTFAKKQINAKKKLGNPFGIDMNEEHQLKVGLEITGKSKDFEKLLSEKELNYNRDNIYYANADALTLYGMIKINKPKQIIEIGCGNSSALIIDIKEKEAKDIDLIFIDPNPNSFMEKCPLHYHKNIIVKKVQDVPLGLFRKLKKNDILFVDSSHVTKAGSDVNHIVFNILPLLNKGVLIHFHDIFYPFEYPEEWLELGYYWNEAYLLQAFLMYNDIFKIEFMNSWFSQTKNDDLFSSKKGRIHSGSLWLRKIN